MSAESSAESAESSRWLVMFNADFLVPIAVDQMFMKISSVFPQMWTKTSRDNKWERIHHRFCHVMRMDRRCIPEQALYWEAAGYSQGPAQPTTNWRGTLKKDLQRMELSCEEAETAALNRQEGRRSVVHCVHADVGWIRVKVKVCRAVILPGMVLPMIICDDDDDDDDDECCV